VAEVKAAGKTNGGVLSPGFVAFVISCEASDFGTEDQEEKGEVESRT
jgi:hypothetical protein